MNAPDTALAPPGPFPSGSPGPDGGIALDALCLRFGQTEALKDVSASIPQGEITGLVGPDAAGKTTLMRVMAGLLRPDSGTARIFGLSPEAAAAAGITGYMPQRFGLYEDLSVQANLALHARLRGVEGEGREELFARLLRFTGLARFTTRLAGKLSGGMKQKLGIACSLLGAPRALLLDEPGVGVDPLSRRELWNMVEELRDGGMTIVWSTAYLDEAERCPHVLMLDAGRVLHVGAPAALVRRARGRVFRLTPPRRAPGAAKALLARWAATSGVEDALIQGSHVRVVLGETHGLEGALRAAGAVAVPPRLEDAYMSALGGISHTPSPFAAAP
ncbi:MAG: ABC transporter ATP-binding protein, partial [Ottowia sp.]|nr:ABC transporter ATP-binding protein [Ottowia sp.]